MTKKIVLEIRDVETECDFSHSNSLFMENHKARVRISFDVESPAGDGQAVRRNINTLIEDIENLIKKSQEETE